jgi:S-adenosylmethionine decarboxylase proenzyme
MTYRHMLLELWVDDRSLVERVEPLRSIILEGAAAIGTNIIYEHFHQFSPHGMTGVMVLAESHVTVHTWVDQGLAVVDVISCGAANPADLAASLEEHLSPVAREISVETRSVERKQ